MTPGLRRTLDSIADTLLAGGVNNPVTYIEQISYLIYLKLLDEEESARELQARTLGNGGNGNSKLLFPKQAEPYRWSKWRFKSGADLRDFVRDKVFPYMASLVKEEPQVAEHFRDAALEIVDPSVLKQVVDELDGINFSKLGTDVCGDISEYLLAPLGHFAPNGQFRTPRQIRAMMVEMVDPDLGDSVFDPACGTGSFLIDAIEHILAKYSGEPHEVPIYGEEWLERRGQTLEQAKQEIPNLQTYRKGPGEKVPDWRVLERSIYGVDVSRQMVRIAVMNLVLHGIRHAAVKRANTLSDMGGLSEDDLARKYKVILSNPPFASVLPKESIRRDLPTNSKKSELLFLGVMMDALAPGGRCAVVVPEGLLFGSTSAHMELRRKLVEDYDLLAVVSLPAGVFKPYTGVKTSVLVFRRPEGAGKEKKEKTQGKVWFYEVRNDGYDPDKIQGGGRPETPEKNDIPDLLARWTEYKKSGFKKPPGVEAGKTLPAGSEEPRCWWATIKMVAENEYNLVAGRYKPQVAKPPPEDDPAQLIREVLQIEREITDGLERLLHELADSTEWGGKKWAAEKLGNVAEINPRTPLPPNLTDRDPVSFVPMSAISAVAAAINTQIARPLREVWRGFTSFRENDVLVANIEPCVTNGKIAHAVGLVNGIGFGSTALHVIRASPVIDARYVYYVLSQESIRAAAKQRLRGNCQQHLPADFLRGLCLPVPPLSEQRRIVALLDQADALRRKCVEAYSEFAARANRILTALFYKEFGDPATNPKGWPTVTIGELVEPVERLDPARFPTQRFAYIAVADVDGTAGAIVGAKSLLGAEAPSNARLSVRDNDVLVATVHPRLRKTALVLAPHDRQLCSVGFGVLRAKAGVGFGFLYSLSRLPWFTDRLAALARGTSFPRVTSSDILGLRVPAPRDTRALGVLDRAVRAILELHGQHRRVASTAERIFQSMLCRHMRNEESDARPTGQRAERDMPVLHDVST